MSGHLDTDEEHDDVLPGSSLKRIETDLLLEGLYLAYGFDFRHYLRSSLGRRISHRMSIEGIPTITALLEKVLHVPGFADKLLNDFSIKVTEMYRDPGFFLAFRKEVVPLLRKEPEIRIWHAGCSTGEEVYSMAILLKECGLLDRVKIYATDMNENVIAAAKLGKFPLKRMQSFTKNYLQAGGSMEFSSYYTTDTEYAYFKSEIKNSMMFAQHNLATDRSFNEFHVILCRNVLIYFDSSLQSRVHHLFYESLSPSGFLCLGTMESLITGRRSQYEDFNPAERIFRKLGR
ncbi:protein-glutamate O-methyltransferase CheR [Paenibacillus sp. N4]|uniref:CheR family methyltransferase n=1 Tax=Paenibacillus vietnamensis TaxID=2590547 RepID=UPI001CD142D9|nr:protein-glutamate O-methyltransferase CheR [Paenibacillus vietnamensis]MCA0756020.1 protein-glutamate O-methyltransferase CheR [Paenibacillus vietnamensis]